MNVQQASNCTRKWPAHAPGSSPPSTTGATACWTRLQDSRRTMQLVVFTPPGPPGPHEVQQANAMLQRGLRCLHLRKPAWPGAANLASYLDQLEPQFHSRVVLHQHHELHTVYGLKGVHYREAERPKPPLPTLSHACTQSTSFHSLEDMQNDWGPLTYAFLSPIFDSISKPGYLAAGFDTDIVQATIHRLSFDVIALGGVTPSNVQQAHDMGFSGVAVLGSIWSSADPLQAFDMMQSACNSAACKGTYTMCTCGTILTAKVADAVSGS